MKEEQLVRFAYAKLQWYLAREAEARGSKAPPARIDVSNPSVGNLADVILAPARTYVTIPEPDAVVPRVMGIIVNGQHGRGEPHYGFELRWQANPDRYNLSRVITVADMIRDGGGSGVLRPARGRENLWGWETYATYDVRVVDGKRDETYKAMMLFGPATGEKRVMAELNYATGAIQTVAEQEGPAIPRHYWQTGLLHRRDGDYGLAGRGGAADTPMCTDLEDPPTWCYGTVCCGAERAECCWLHIAHGQEVGK